MVASAVILRLLLASLVGFWLPAQCCSAAHQDDGQAAEVRTVMAEAEMACEKPCCGTVTSHDTDTPAAPHDKPCDCDHPTPAKHAVVEGGRTSVTPSALGEFLHPLPPLPAISALDDVDDALASPRRPVSANAPVPTVTLRTLRVLLTV